MKKNKVLGIIALVFSALVLFATSQLKLSMQLATGDPGPWLFPIIAAALIGICGVVLLLDKSEAAAKPFLTAGEWKRAVLLYGIFVVYAVCIVVFGFLYSSIVMLFVCCTLFAGEKKIPLYVRVLYAVILGVGIWYLLGSVFKVTLPAGILFG